MKYLIFKIASIFKLKAEVYGFENARVIACKKTGTSIQLLFSNGNITVGKLLSIKDLKVRDLKIF